MTIQALADGGVKMGLNRDQSLRLAAQLMLVCMQIKINMLGDIVPSDMGLCYS